ncbi:MAG TPA: helix-turn-helix domain-containing protein [Jatrophihabitantaceae bacterium]|jgi:predicted ArsR family transcriptional regulator|nr:helix-turn-helix domain-containing protein [Jatrophihabitantaceae bacterium]
MATEHEADLDAQLSGIASLAEPVRRTLYRFVIGERAPVSREQAAAAIGVAHHVAKFHLDRLEQDGLLQTEYSRPPGRTGPGAGRPAKLYRRADRQVDVSLPQRHYDLAGLLLAEAITTAERSGARVDTAVRKVATDAGRAIAQRCAPDATIASALADNGFEPFATESGLALANCPFHRLAQSYPELVCGLNLHLIRGLVSGLGATDVRAKLDPSQDRCCVVLTQPVG